MSSDLQIRGLQHFAPMPLVLTICYELVQILCDLLAHNIWPTIPVHGIAQDGQNDFLRQG